MTVSVIDSINVRYVMTEDGEKSDVIIPVASWEALVDWIKGLPTQIDDDGELKPEMRERLLRQSAMVENGSAELIPFADVLEKAGVADGSNVFA